MACMKWGRHRHKKDKERHGDTELATDAAMEDSHGGSPNITGGKFPVCIYICSRRRKPHRG